MPTLTVDGIEVTVEPGTTVLQACEIAGKEIPRFCYHERLSIAGNCRMCLVEMERSPKPIASCAMPAGDNMVIRTDTEQVKKAREGVMEFLLINHPLDCPICDQGGECDLQDQAMAYGRDATRYQENKRSVEEKDFGPLVKTFMTRCIHCTRCVRFMEEVAGVPTLGGLWRGEEMEISTTIEAGLNSELSGNIIDLCPVGALTSKPYAFNARSWELQKTESIDVMDAVGTNIRVDCRGPQVMRVLPRLNEDVNEEWLADKGRFSYDGLKKQRLDRPYVRGNDGKLHPSSWQDAFAAIQLKISDLKKTEIGALTGDLCEAESMSALADLIKALGSQNIDCRQDGAQLSTEARGHYLFNTTIAGIDDADTCVFIGTNPRWEAPLINARLRQRWLAGGFTAGQIGEAMDLGFETQHLGAGPRTLEELLNGSHAFSAVLEKSVSPMLIIGMGALARDDGAAIFQTGLKLADRYGMVTDNWNGFNVLHRAAARVGGLDLGLVPGKSGLDRAGMIAAAGKGRLKFLYLLGADELPMEQLGDCFVVYQGHHGDAGANRADVVLPGCAYTEKPGLYVNTEGRVQEGLVAAAPPGDAREDWTILRALSEVLGHKLPYDSREVLRKSMEKKAKHFANIDEIIPAKFSLSQETGEMDPAPFVTPIVNYYMTDPISRASETMAQCTRQFTASAATLAASGAAE